MSTVLFWLIGWAILGKIDTAGKFTHKISEICIMIQKNCLLKCVNIMYTYGEIFMSTYHKRIGGQRGKMGASLSSPPPIFLFVVACQLIPAGCEDINVFIYFLFIFFWGGGGGSSIQSCAPPQHKPWIHPWHTPTNTHTYIHTQNGNFKCDSNVLYQFLDLSHLTFILYVWIGVWFTSTWPRLGSMHAPFSEWQMILHSHCISVRSVVCCLSFSNMKSSPRVHES